MDRTEDGIRLRAYQIWESEGRPSGMELEHWRRAEEELEGDASMPFPRPAVISQSPESPGGLELDEDVLFHPEQRPDVEVVKTDAVTSISKT